jgi:hypothetical protein
VGLTVSAELRIEVADSIPHVSLLPLAQPLEDAAVTLAITATVPSSGESIARVEVDCEHVPPGFDVDLQDVAGDGLACPGYASPGPRLIAVRAFDGEGEASDVVVAGIDVTGVNDAPSFEIPLETVFAAGSTGLQTIHGFAAFDAGAPDEQATQSVLDYVVEVIDDQDAVLAPAGVQVDAAGALHATLTGRSGHVLASARVRDSGGTQDGGIDVSAPRQFILATPAATDLQVGINNHRPVLVDGEVTTYAVVVANAGPNSVADTVLDYTVSTTLADATWSCVQSLSTAICPDFIDAGSATVNLDVGQHLRFDIVARADAAAGAFARTDAHVLLPEGTVALLPADDAAVDSDPIVPIGLFGSGFEAANTVTVPAAREALLRVTR